MVYGVRRDGTGVGGAVVTAIKDGGYAGGLTVVHPSSPEVLGVPAYSTAREASEPIDLAVIAVPAEGVVAALEDAASAGARGAVVISSGFR